MVIEMSNVAQQSYIHTEDRVSESDNGVLKQQRILKESYEKRPKGR